MSPSNQELIPAWPIEDRIALKLLMIKQIGEGSTTANSLPHVARIANEALECIRQHRAGTARTEADQTCTACHADFAHKDAQVVWELEHPDQKQTVCPVCQSLLTAQVPHE
jgi:uncharacterized paraquat-inducible protein A